MAADRKRGRPKGTGINDHEMLLKIAQIMVANPATKRTTAIKDVGITNASVVRRLRDKYQAEEASLLAEVHAANSAASAQPATGKGSRKAATAASAATNVEAPAAIGLASVHAGKSDANASASSKKGKVATGQATMTVAATVQVPVEPIVAAPQATAQQVAASPAKPAAATPTVSTNAKPAVDPLAALFEGLNIETLVTQFIGHALGLSAAEIKNSPIPALIRQQAQLADLVLPLLASQFLGQKQTTKAA